jgi:hypothetical protein
MFRDSSSAFDETVAVLFFTLVFLERERCEGEFSAQL